jgi:NhaP-type Na+/H+ or K+/H+ antiporter
LILKVPIYLPLSLNIRTHHFNHYFTYHFSGFLFILLSLQVSLSVDNSTSSRSRARTNESKSILEGLVTIIPNTKNNQVLVFLYFRMGGMFSLYIVGLFCYICIIYYLYFDYLIPLAGLHFCVGLDFVTPAL